MGESENPGERQKPLCGRRRKRCRKCDYRFTKEDYELWNCPICGLLRKCTRGVDFQGQACYWHGGNSLKGPASAQYKDGSRSKYAILPPDVAERVERAVNDPNLLSVRHEIGLLTARREQLEERLKTGEYSGLWAQLEKLGASLSAACQAVKEGDASRIEERDALIETLLKIIDGGVNQNRTWDDLTELLERVDKLKASERKREQELKTLVPVEQCLALMFALVETARTHISDKKVIDSIVVEVDRLAHFRPKEKES